MGPGDHRAVLRRRPRHRHRSRLRGAMGVRAVQAGRRRQADRGEARTDQLGQARGHGRDRAAVRVDHQRHDRRCRPACRPAKPDPAARSRRSPSCWAATSPRPRPSPACWPPPEAVFAAVDILDSRYRDYRFALPDVIADNASAGRVVLASRPANLVDLRLVGCLLRAGGPWRPRRRGRSWGTRQSRWPGWPTASAHAVSACARDGWCCPVASPRRCRSNRARPSRQNWTGWVRWRSTAAGGHSVSSWRRLVRVSSISSDPCPDRMVRVAYKVKPLIWP